MAFLNLLDGYKTYLVAFALGCLAIFEIANGQVIQGIQTLLSALAMAGLRGAVSKLQA